jgi:hypothetical protein
MLNEDWQGGQLMLGASMLLAAALVLGVSNFVHIDQAKYAVNDIIVAVLQVSIFIFVDL